MDYSQFLFQLKQTLDVQYWQKVISALRQDALIWKCVSHTPLNQLALEKLGNQPEAWNPASLALLCLDTTLSWEQIRQAPLETLDSELYLKANQTFEQFMQSGLDAMWSTQPGDIEQGEWTQGLAQAGLLALALKDRNQQTGNPSEYVLELLEAGDASPSFWRPLLGILFAILQDPQRLLEALIQPSSSIHHYQLGIHALLCNPLPQEEITQTLFTTITEARNGKRLTVDDISRLVYELSLQRQEASRDLAFRLIENGIESTDDSRTGSFCPVTHIKRQIHLAELNRRGEKPAKALELLKQAQRETRLLEAGLLALRAESATLENSSEKEGPLAGEGETKTHDDIFQTWEQAIELAVQVPESGLHRTLLGKLTQAYLDAGKTVEARWWLAQADDQETAEEGKLHSDVTGCSEIMFHPDLDLGISKALLAYQSDDHETAKTAALSALQVLMKMITPRSQETHNQLFHPIPLFNQQVTLSAQKLARLLFDLGLFNEAASATESSLSFQPNERNLLQLQGEALYAGCHPDLALKALHLANLLLPEDATIRRTLAESLEACEDWEAALVERKAIIHLGEPDALPQRIDDLHDLAHCAINASAAQEAIDACREALSIDSEDGLSYCYVGEACVILGDTQTGLEHFEKAILLAPQLPEPWIAQSNVYRRRSENRKVLETLQEASQALPESEDIHLALGEAYLADSSPTLALESLKRAYILAEDKGWGSNPRKIGLYFRIATRLGETHRVLGHLEESWQVLTPAYNKLWDQNHNRFAGLAYAYAQTALARGEPQIALPALEKAIASFPDNPEILLNYGRALLAIGQSPEKAVEVLESVLESEPEHHEGKALYAEALAATGKHNQAMKVYQKVLETDLVKDRTWLSRLSLGLGRSALALDQIDTALAALQEAAQADPQSQVCQRFLAEAYWSAGLMNNALTAARTAVQLDSEDLDTLVWFAEKVPSMVAATGTATLVEPVESTGKPVAVQSRQLLIEGLNALEHAIQIAPHRADLMVRLGRLQTLNGDLTASKQTLRQVALLETAKPADLRQAAESLLDLDDAVGAVANLEAAVRKAALNTLPTLDSLLAELAQAHLKNGNIQATLAALDEAIQLAPENGAYYRSKAHLLLRVGELKEAQKCVEQALHLAGDVSQHPALHYLIALILRARGELNSALAHTEQSLAAYALLTGRTQLDPLYFAVSHLAADIWMALVQPEKARNLLGKRHLLSNASVPPSQLDPIDLAGYLGYFCLSAELALDQDDVKAAEDALSQATSIAPDLPRVMAVQARLIARQDEYQKATEVLMKALEAIRTARTALEHVGQKSDATPANLPGASHLIGIAKAAIELNHWDPAIFLAREAVQLASKEPSVHFNLARSLVMRAEYQRLCSRLDVIAHAPGTAALGQSASNTTISALDQTDTLLQHYEEQIEPHDAANLAFRHVREFLSRWKQRAEIVFDLNQQANYLAQSKFLPDNTYSPAPRLSSDDTASWIAALNQMEPRETDPSVWKNKIIEAAMSAAQSYPKHPRVLLEVGLTLAEILPEEAFLAVHAAVNLLSKQHSPLSAMSNALLAKLSKRAGDFATALKAILSALDIWPVEPRWHALAARLIQDETSISNEEQTDPIFHMEEAVKLEPRNIDHHLALGDIYLQRARQDPDYGRQAIQCYERACRLAPELPEPWMVLARAYLTIGDESAHNQAANCAEQAIVMINRQSDLVTDPQPYILRSEIALLNGDLQFAHQYAEMALQVQSQDPEAVLIMERVLVALDRTEEALQLLEEFLTGDHPSLPLQLARADLIRKVRGPEIALSILRDLAENNPEEPAVLTSLARTLSEVGKHEAAIRAAQLALQAMTLNIHQRSLNLRHIGDIEQADIHMMLGRLLRQEGQLDQSIYHLNESIHLNPENLDAYLELSLAHQDRRQHLKALQVLQRATIVSPQDPRAYYQAGLALKDGKDYQAAESMLRRAAELAPNDVNVRRQLAAVIAINLVHNPRISKTSPSQG